MVEDGISEGVIADGGIPLVYRQLAGHECRGGEITVIHDVHEVMALCGVESFQAPVIDDKQPGVSELVKEFVIAAVGLSLCECEEQVRQAIAAGGHTLPAGLVSQGA